MAFIITCEHGGNKIPSNYQYLFRDKKKTLNSHRGWDAGALVLAKKLAKELNAPLFYSEVSRLLIDLNRSLHHSNLFSELSTPLDTDSKQKIIDKIYYPYRNEVKNEIKKLTYKSSIVHLSIHSFTPVLDNEIRDADIGLLYDSSRKKEKIFCGLLDTHLKNHFTDLKIRRNYPYKGNADGFTTYLRKEFSEMKYLGIEIEINQKHILTDNQVWSAIKKELGKIILNL